MQIEVESERESIMDAVAEWHTPPLSRAQRREMERRAAKVAKRAVVA